MGINEENIAQRIQDAPDTSNMGMNEENIAQRIQDTPDTSNMGMNEENIAQRIQDAPDTSNNGDVSEKAKEVLTPDEKRKETEKTHIHGLSIVLLYVLVFCAVAIALVVVLHLVLPEKYRWLKSEEVISLKSIFVSGAGGAILAKFGNKLVDK